MENPIKMDDLGLPLFLETPIYIYIYIHHSISTQPSWNRGNTKMNYPQEIAPQNYNHYRILHDDDLVYCTKGIIVGGFNPSEKY